MDYLFLLGRILLGVYFITSGLNHFRNLEGTAGYAASKGLPMPKAGVIISAVMMIAGGAGILLGGWVKLSVVLLVLFLLTASFKIHTYWKIADPMQRMGEKINFTKNIGLAGAILMLLSIPTPWVLSLFN